MHTSASSVTCVHFHLSCYLKEAEDCKQAEDCKLVESISGCIIGHTHFTELFANVMWFIFCSFDFSLVTGHMKTPVN